MKTIYKIPSHVQHRNFYIYTLRKKKNKIYMQENANKTPRKVNKTKLIMINCQIKH